MTCLETIKFQLILGREFDLSVNEHGIEATLEPKQHPRKRPAFESQLNQKKKCIGPIVLSLFFFLLLLDLVIYFANVWNETEADNMHERRDFSKSSLKPFFHGALQLLLCKEDLLEKSVRASEWKLTCK